jgi:hypothetical protein
MTEKIPQKEIRTLMMTTPPQKRRNKKMAIRVTHTAKKKLFMRAVEDVNDKSAT